MTKWSDGIYLLGNFNQLKAGCWLLIHKKEAAILDMPTYELSEFSPACCCSFLIEEGYNVRFLLSSHSHWDHFSLRTLQDFHKKFPTAMLYLSCQYQHIPPTIPTTYFQNETVLDLGGEPLYLVHAPKHSLEDTIVIFRGTAMMGDWELNTIYSVHNDVTIEKRRISIERMMEFEKEKNYKIKRTFANHGNERRDEVDFTELMKDTLLERKLFD